MPLQVSIPDAKSLYPGLWRASIEPASLRMFGSSQSAVGLVSVVLLVSEPTFSRAVSSISFDPATARVLNAGSTDDTILIYAGKSPGFDPRYQIASEPLEGKLIGDNEFLVRLTPELRALGTALLDAVRKQFPGQLVFHPKSEKFVDSPDNFWTVRIQPRDVSLRVTVRGSLTAFGKPKKLELKRDMTSYSAFKIARMDQIPEAVEIIRLAASR